LFGFFLYERKGQMNISPDIVQQILTLLGQAASATTTTVAPAPVATASPSWVAAVTAAFPAIVGSNGKRGSMNITKNPCFMASTKEVQEGANNEIANGKPGIWCAEACYRAAKKSIAVSEYLKAKTPAPAKTATPAPAATVATIPPELAAMAEQMGFTLVPKADAPVAPPVKRMKGQARLTCLQTALAAAKAGDRNAAKVELVQVGLLKESDKMRLGKMIPLIEAEIAKMTTVTKAPHTGVPNLTVA
jgi:hypothetical protein